MQNSCILRSYINYNMFSFIFVHFCYIFVFCLYIHKIVFLLFTFVI